MNIKPRKAFSQARLWENQWILINGAGFGCISFNPDGTRLASSLWDNTIQTWDIASGKELNAFRGHKDRINSVLFSPDGTILASASNDKTVRLWDVERGKELTVFDGYEKEVINISFNSEGTILAAAFEGGSRLSKFPSNSYYNSPLFGFSSWLKKACRLFRIV